MKKVRKPGETFSDKEIRKAEKKECEER